MFGITKQKAECYGNTYGSQLSKGVKDIVLTTAEAA
jgi:hypothetical protein